MSEVINELVREIRSGRIKLIDLTKPLSPVTPVISLPPPFADAPPFSRKVIAQYDERGPDWYWSEIRMGEHTGTHFDAPIHWITGRDLPHNSCDTLLVQNLVGMACVIDAVTESSRDDDYLLTRERILQWEQEHGKIPQRSWILMRTEWSRRTEAADFLNADDDGPHSPGFDQEACHFLIYERDILGIGVETVGIDPGQAFRFKPPFPNHATVLGAGRFGLASLCNLTALPAIGAFLVACPLKIVKGSGSPTRVLAFVHHGSI
ncbi:MAG: cyclase family protein [Acidobacteria bacterium]|nr:cyclase family protein [Acidobacteriota bacterium]